MRTINSEIFSTLKNTVYTHLHSENHQMMDTYAHYYDEEAIIPNTILFESRNGEAFIGSPYALFKQMYSDPRFQHFTFYWVYQEGYDLNTLKAPLQLKEDGPDVRFIVRDSDDYLKQLASCQYLINHITFPSYFVKKEGQVYINTWHGTPLKTLGFDIPHDPFNTQNIIRNFLMTDYLLSPNKHTSDILLNSYKLEGIYNGQILETGYPRMDATVNAQTSEDIRRWLALYNVEIDAFKPTIMYTPTWRGQTGTKSINTITQFEAEMTYLEQELGDKYNILIKVHPYAYESAKDSKILASKLIPNTLDINEIMPLMDAMITDYSSVFFDYMVLNRPIYFYTWDADLYENNRGMYFEPEELPGPISLTIQDVVKQIQTFGLNNSAFADNYQKLKAQLNSYDDGKATKRVIDYIFFQKTKHVTVRLAHTDKKHLLFYPGGMFNNGITSSVINLFNQLDYDQYDVTVLMNNSRAHERVQNIVKLNPNVRLMYAFGTPLYTVREAFANNLLMNYPTKHYFDTYYPQKAYQRETNRLLPQMRFDVAIDFSGYSYDWTKYIAEVPASRRLIYMHNDLATDVNKVVNGEQPHIKSLTGTFLLYRKFDELISVSPALAKINVEKLSDYAPKRKFTYVFNTIDYKALQQQKEHVETSDFPKIITIKQPLTCLTSQPIQFYPSLTDLKTYQTYTINDKDHIESYGEYLTENQAYFKVCINGIYVGWAEQKFFARGGEEPLCEKDIHRYALVEHGKGRMIYTYPPYAKPNVERVSSLSRLQDVIVYIDRSMTTSTGTYLHIILDGKDIGWAKQTGFTFINKAASIIEDEIHANHYTHQDKIKALPTFSKERQTVATIKDTKATCYTWLPGLPKTRRKWVRLMQNEPVRITWQMNNNLGHYIKCTSLKSQKTFWINENAVEFRMPEQPCTTKTKAVNHQVQLIGKNIPLFHRIDDIAELYSQKEPDMVQWQKEHLDTWLSYSQQIVHQSANIQTIFGPFAEIEMDGKTYYVSKKYIKSQDRHTQLPALNHNNFNIATAGRLSPEKNHAALIKAIALLFFLHPKLRQSVRLYILGDGLLHQDLKKLIHRLHLENNVFLTGYVCEPYTFIQQCDIFILPSLYEGQPMTLLESLTLRIPTLASNIPVNQYVLGQNKYGYLIQGTTTRAIEKGLFYYMKHPKTYQKFDYKRYNQIALDQFNASLEDNVTLRQQANEEAKILFNE